MSKYVSSKMKTFLRRNGFKDNNIRMTNGDIFKGKFHRIVGRWTEYTVPRQPMRETTGYVVRNGRHFRVQESLDNVDIGCLRGDFDRWANSIERSMSIKEFMLEFAKPKK